MSAALNASMQFVLPIFICILCLFTLIDVQIICHTGLEREFQITVVIV